MKNKFIKVIFVVLAASLMVACNSREVLPEENEKYEEEVPSVSESDQISEEETLSGNNIEIDEADLTQEPEESIQDTLSGNNVKPDSETVKVRGIYVTGPMAGSANFDNLVKLVDETDLNAMVIDVKNDDGNLTYDMDLDVVREIGNSKKYIKDIHEFMNNLKEHNIYTIARIVCFKDPYLAKSKPELALLRPDGKPVTDGNGLPWVNPYKKEVWEYLNTLAEKAIADGFDEVQFDYVRFPVGVTADYKVAAEYTKERGISNFFEYTADNLGSKGIIFGADLFGTIIGSQIDTDSTGQNYVTIAQYADNVCPMIYPSHYGPGNFNLSVPDAYPYETVYGALMKSQGELEALPEAERAVVRPWLQSFTATWVSGHIKYGPAEVNKQIQAVYDAGYDQWILWNASNKYTYNNPPIEN